MNYHITKLKNNFAFINSKFVSEIETNNNIIGQKRAEEAVEFGLNVENKGYNVFIEGYSGTGRTSIAKKYALKASKSKNVPHDICYINNFKNPKEPKYLLLEAGLGKLLKADMQEFISSLIIDLKKLSYNFEFLAKKSDITSKYQSKRESILDELSVEAKLQNFSVKTSNTGIYFVPIVEGEVIGEEQFDELPDDVKSEITANSAGVQRRATEIMQLIKIDEEMSKEEVKNIEYLESLLIVGFHFKIISEKYIENESVIKFLSEVKEDILENIEEFLEEEEEESAVASLIPWASKDSFESKLKYEVNLIVDNSLLENAPVVILNDCSYSKVVGEIEYDTSNGNLLTDFTQIKAGALHRANGGFLIVQAHDLLINPGTFDALMQALTNEEIVIETQKELSTGISINALKPEPIKLDIKIIIIGSPTYFDIMNEYDEKFCKLFKVIGEVDYEMDCNEITIKELIGFIKQFSNKEKSLPFEIDAILKILDYSARSAGTQKKLTTNFSEIEELLIESTTWAKLDKSNNISADYVQKAINKKIYRLNLYEEKLNEMIENDLVLIETTGEKIGQVNGLAVLDMGSYMFGKPSKITATTYVGRLGIVNIEKESELSGSFHDKGLQIIEGYMGQTYAQDFPLSISSKICFEQNYSGIDGDSASSTELYCLISSITSLPIKQNIAVTGSVNQYGFIQPIGGVTQKIEGFFDLCKFRVLDGSHGVIIPYQNVYDLTLKDEVIAAVKDGMFHIYPVKHVNEGLEILLGKIAGEKDERGKYPKETINALVHKKLKRFYNKALSE